MIGAWHRCWRWRRFGYECPFLPLGEHVPEDEEEEEEEPEEKPDVKAPVPAKRPRPRPPREEWTEEVIREEIEVFDLPRLPVPLGEPDLPAPRGVAVPSRAGAQLDPTRPRLGGVPKVAPIYPFEDGAFLTEGYEKLGIKSPGVALDPEFMARQVPSEKMEIMEDILTRTFLEYRPPEELTARQKADAPKRRSAVEKSGLPDPVLYLIVAGAAVVVGGIILKNIAKPPPVGVSGRGPAAPRSGGGGGLLFNFQERLAGQLGDQSSRKQNIGLPPSEFR